MSIYTPSNKLAVPRITDFPPEATKPTPSDGVDHGLVAKALYLDRRERRHLFDDALFGEPAWDMLLDLRSQHGGKQMPSSLSVCAGAEASSSTGLRNIRALEKAGLVERRSDPKDSRRRIACLSSRGVRLMDQYIDQLLVRHSLTMVDWVKATV